MKNLIFILTLFSLLGCKGIQNKQTAKQDLPQVALLGTFHFAGTRDLASVQIKDLFSTKRQKELEELVAQISQFKPTKILIEWEPRHKVKTDSLFQKYLSGDFQLKQNEVYQIAFRLAKKLKLKELFPIDYKMNLGDKKMMDFIESHDKKVDFKNFMKHLQTKAEEHNQYLEGTSFSNYFKLLNSDDSDNWNRNLYLEELPKISNLTANPIIEYSANWYKRNLFIMNEIDKIAEKGDRLLVLIGAGHRAILKDLYKNRESITYIEISDFINR